MAPGVIDTEMNRQLSQETKAALAEETPLERLGTPEDVAQYQCQDDWQRFG